MYSRNNQVRFPLHYFKRFYQVNHILHLFATEEICSASPVADNFKILFDFLLIKFFDGEVFLSHQLIGAEEILKLNQAEKIKAKIYVFKVNLYHI